MAVCEWMFVVLKTIVASVTARHVRNTNKATLISWKRFPLCIHNII